MCAKCSRREWRPWRRNVTLDFKEQPTFSGALALVPAAEESRPLLGMLMVAGITALLLAIGLMIYGAGRVRARRAEQR